MSSVEKGIAYWYALHKRARHEKAVSERLEEEGIPTFLPLVGEVHRWRDRRKTVQLPLFSCYGFVKLVPQSRERMRVDRINGALGIVGVRGQGITITQQLNSLPIQRANTSCSRLHPGLSF